MHWQWTTIGIAWLSLTLAGCQDKSGGRVEIHGQVTVDGQPVETGSIAFIPVGVPNGTTAGGTISKGVYRTPAAQGPLPGHYRVEIKAMRSTGKKIVDDMLPSSDNLVDAIEQFLPARFNTQSTLTAEIGAEPKATDFHLQLP